MSDRKLDAVWTLRTVRKWTMESNQSRLSEFLGLRQLASSHTPARLADRLLLVPLKHLHEQSGASRMVEASADQRLTLLPGMRRAARIGYVRFLLPCGLGSRLELLGGQKQAF